MVLNVVGSNPIGHPSSNPLQLCVVRDFFVYLPPSPLTPCCPPAQPRCDKPPVAVHSRHAPFLVSRPCCRRCACRTVALDRKSAACLLPCSPPRAPMPVVAENDLPSYAKRDKPSARVGKGCPGADAFLEKTVGCCRNVHFLARGSACAHHIFRFLPSLFTYLCKTQ